MRSASAPLLAALLGALAGCGSGSHAAPGGSAMAVSVGGSLCGAFAASSLDMPCVSVTVCAPGSSLCDVVDGVLLDTGSSGLRVFSQVLPRSVASLPPVLDGASGQPIAECVTFADLTSDWGPVRLATVALGGEPPTTMAIQVIDSTFASSSRPTACSNADLGPFAAGLNGILGVSVFAQDCGPFCAQPAGSQGGIGMYYACGASSCAQASVPLAKQVWNPVALLPTDNNGVVIELPAVPASGAPSVEGRVVLGIGAPASPGVRLSLDGAGEFTTILGTSSYPAFADTGSNGLFFPPPSSPALPTCPAPNSGWYCPPSTVSLSATNLGAGGFPSSAVSFQIGSIDALGTSIHVSPVVGGPAPTSLGFDWGLPFHLGRQVYVGLEGTTSVLGAGPYVAY